MHEPLFIDGKEGEGGGQVLRTSLSLSAITRKPFIIENIRGKRKKPGLKRQHLVAVEAVAAISKARCEGNTLNSTRLAFYPETSSGGNFNFNIGSAGSTTLVFQTILPVLLHANSPSTVVIKGGTHNPMAPTADFLSSSFLPLLRKWGVNVSFSLESYGFYPSGGGKIKAEIVPLKNRLKKLELGVRGELKRKRAEILIAKLPNHIAGREKEVLLRQGWFVDDGINIKRVKESPGPGNVLTLVLEYEKITCVFHSFGERGKRAEVVAKEALDEALFHHRSGMPVERHLADQILLYMALAGGSEIRTSAVSLHARTNMSIIEKFTLGRFRCREIKGGWSISYRNFGS